MKRLFWNLFYGGCLSVMIYSALAVGSNPVEYISGLWCCIALWAVNQPDSDDT